MDDHVCLLFITDKVGLFLWIVKVNLKNIIRDFDV